MNLSTDMAVNMCKKFLKEMAQPDENKGLGVSLWDIGMVEKAIADMEGDEMVDI